MCDMYLVDNVYWSDLHKSFEQVQTKYLNNWCQICVYGWFEAWRFQFTPQIIHDDRVANKHQLTECLSSKI